MLFHSTLKFTKEIEGYYNAILLYFPLFRDFEYRIISLSLHINHYHVFILTTSSSYFYIGDFLLDKDLPEVAVEQLKSLNFLGDFFLSENWFYLAEKKLKELFKIYKTNSEFYEISTNGEIQNKNDDFGIVSTDQVVIIRATIDNLLIVMREILNVDNGFNIKLKKRIRVLNNIDDDLYDTVLEIIKLKGTENESHIDLIDKAETLFQLITNPE